MACFAAHACAALAASCVPLAAGLSFARIPPLEPKGAPPSRAGELWEQHARLVGEEIGKALVVQPVEVSVH